MTVTNINFEKVAAFLFCFTILGYLLVAGKAIFMPLAFGIFLAFMLYPVCRFWENKGLERSLAIGLTFLLLFAVLGGVILLFSSQLFSVVSQLSGLQQKLTELAGTTLAWLEYNFNIDIQKSWLQDNLASMIQTPLTIIGASIKSSTTLLANIILSLIYAVLFLLYRTSLKNFWLTQFEDQKRSVAKHIVQQIQKVIQQYLYGLSLVILILGVLNSLGLWIIGIDYPIFWGFFSALLAIIPYVGTFIGAFLPFLYALLTTSTIWQPVGVALLFVSIQQIEGNIITPKLVGSNIKINPLAAIFSLIVGGYLWGVAGLILALPFVAILKITLNNIEILKPWSALLSSELYKEEDIFHKRYNKGLYRILRIFSKNKIE